MFIGREKELAMLKEELASRGRRTAVLIYGKRRVGKSTLIQQAAQDFPGAVINHLCVQSTFEGNIELIARSVCEALSLPRMRFESLFDLMDFLGTQERDILLIIDEYPYLKQTRKQNEVDSYMQAVIDRMPSNVKLILCGSFISIMKELLAESNPLFGRFSLMLHIRDFDYRDAACFYPDLPVAEKAAFYAVFGGSPYVLENLRADASLRENLETLLLPETGLIRSHIENVMLNEVRKSFDIRILEALGNGRKRFSEIADLLRMEDASLLDKQLKTLLTMETIQKSEPLNRRDDKKKKFYEIVDNLMRFYFAFIFGSAGTIARVGGEQFYRTHIEGERLRQFISRRLEGIALQYFHRMAGTGAFADVEDFGSYWYDDPHHRKNGEFDCVLRRQDGRYDFFECKYFDRKMTLAECQEEEAQVRGQPGLAVSRVGFVCTGGFDFADTGTYTLIDGEALYNGVR